MRRSFDRLLIKLSILFISIADEFETLSQAVETFISGDSWEQYGKELDAQLIREMMKARGV